MPPYYCIAIPAGIGPRRSRGFRTNPDIEAGRLSSAYQRNRRWPRSAPIATIGSVQDLIRELRRRGEIDSDGVMNSLLAKAQAAAASIARGNRTAALNQLGALLNELAAQSGKHITARGAAIASADVQYVMAHLP